MGAISGVCVSVRSRVWSRQPCLGFAFGSLFGRLAVSLAGRGSVVDVSIVSVLLLVVFAAAYVLIHLHLSYVCG